MFPGGKVDPGESFEFAGLRELEEESGMHLDKNSKKSLTPIFCWEAGFPLYPNENH